MTKQSPPLFHPLIVCFGCCSTSTVTADQPPPVSVWFPPVTAFQTPEVRRGHKYFSGEPRQAPAFNILEQSRSQSVVFFCPHWFIKKTQKTTQFFCGLQNVTLMLQSLWWSCTFFYNCINIQHIEPINLIKDCENKSSCPNFTLVLDNLVDLEPSDI